MVEQRLEVCIDAGGIRAERGDAWAVSAAGDLVDGPGVVLRCQPSPDSTPTSTRGRCASDLPASSLACRAMSCCGLSRFEPDAVSAPAASCTPAPESPSSQRPRRSQSRVRAAMPRTRALECRDARPARRRAMVRQSQRTSGQPLRPCARLQGSGGDVSRRRQRSERAARRARRRRASPCSLAFCGRGLIDNDCTVATSALLIPLAAFHLTVEVQSLVWPRRRRAAMPAPASRPSAPGAASQPATDGYARDEGAR